MTYRTLRRGRAPAMIMAACAGLALVVAGPAAAGTSTDSRQVAFAGAVYLTEPNETVDITGAVHLSTRLSGSESSGWTLEWQANLDSTTGTGRTSGSRYVGSGADTGTVFLPPGPPVRSASLYPVFRLLPPGPPTHPPSPIRFGMTAHYGETGRVTSVDIHIEGSFGPID